MTDSVFCPLPKFSLPEEIIGDKVILKRRSHEYDEALFALINSSRNFLREYLYWIDDTQTIENVVNVTNIFSQDWDEQNSFEYVILDKQLGKLVGAGGAHTINYNHHLAKFGYYRDVKASRKGYICEFVKLLEKELFQHGIHRLEIACDGRNRASAKVAERNGFLLEGTFKNHCFVYGEYRDGLLYAKINPEK